MMKQTRLLHQIRHLMRLASSLLLVIVGLLICRGVADAQVPTPTRRVNAPHFEDTVPLSQSAIFWFGQVDTTHNYADVRVGYTDAYLQISVAVIDRYLWYDRDPVISELTDWDAVTLYLDTKGDGGAAPAEDDYRFVGQLNWWEPREAWQAASRGDGENWISAMVPFTTTSSWRSIDDAPNDNRGDDRGWVLTFRVPFESVGLAAPPDEAAVWGMGLALHDRDDAAGTPIPDATWPEALSPSEPDTWGELAFGMPTHRSPIVVGDETTVIRDRLDDASVPDVAVGGTIDNLCPGSPSWIWSGWGDANFAGARHFNVSNLDVGDWPCIARYYVTFPLDAIPQDSAIVSASLTLYQWGGSDLRYAKPSLIQALTIGEAWDETTLTWNNAPLAIENVAATWVDPVPEGGVQWPGFPHHWDVSRAVAQAHVAGTPLRLAFYEADWALHSGKYFVASEEGDWNAVARPTLRVRWGEPVGGVEKAVTPAAAQCRQPVTYTLSLLGNGRVMTLTDELPVEVTAPSRQTVGLTYTPHRLSWTGQPAVGEQVTLSYVVTPTICSPSVLINRAVVTQEGGLTETATAYVLVDAQQIYLPTVQLQRP